MYRNRVALVTGGASGIGKCLAEHLSTHGATVICVDLNEDAGNTTARNFNASHARSTPIAHFIRGDVTNWKSVCDIFYEADELLRKHHNGAKLDFVFANAGVVGRYDLTFSKEPDLADIKVNTIGVTYTIHAAMSYFIKYRHQGRIIVTASQAALYPLNDAPLYSASKHAVLALVRSLGRRAIREGVMINAVGPGVTESGIASKENFESLISLGWYTKKETILRAFDLLLAPTWKHSGKFVSAVGDTVSVQEFPRPGKLPSKL